MKADRHADASSNVVFQCPYGPFQPRYLVFFALVGLLGLIAVPVGFWGNRGWQVGNRPLDPRSATVIIEIFAITAIAVAAATGLSSYLRRKSPQRVAVTRSALIVPQGMFSRGELQLPFAEIKTSVFNAGFVKQLQIQHGRKKILLTSAAFPSTADFDRLISHLPEPS